MFFFSSLLFSLDFSISHFFPLCGGDVVDHIHLGESILVTGKGGNGVGGVTLVAYFAGEGGGGHRRRAPRPSYHP